MHHAAPPVVGGVERVLGAHARLLADAGHDVRLMVGRGAPDDPRVVAVHVPLVDSRHPEVVALGAALASGRVPPSFAGLRDRIVETLRPALGAADVVFCHNVCSLANNLPLTAALRILADEGPPPRFVIWHHDLAGSASCHRAPLPAGQPWDLLRTAWPGAVQVVVSEERRRELSRLTGLAEPDIRVVPNGVDVARMLKLDGATLAMLRGTSIAEVEPLLLMPSRILPRKNIELGLRTVAALRTMGRTAGLVVTGPVDPHHPDASRYLHQLLDLRHELGLDEGAWFPGAGSDEGLPDVVVADLHALADVSFVPSREEGFGLPVLEALLHRLPIVCAELPTLREVAGDAALYIDPDADPGLVARQVLTLLDQPPVRRSMRVRRESSWEEIGRRWIEPLLAELAR